MRRCTCATLRIFQRRRSLRSSFPASHQRRSPRFEADASALRGLIGPWMGSTQFTQGGCDVGRGAWPSPFVPIEHVSFGLHAGPDRRSNHRRAGDRRDHPGPGVIRVLDVHGVGRRRAARLKVGLVVVRQVIAANRRIVGSASADTKQHGGHDQGGTRRNHGADGTRMARIRQ